MENITVKKSDLLSILKENREAHRDIFLKAQDIYRERMVEEFEISLKDAREGRKIRRGVSIPEPEDHTKDYDRIIRMMELTIHEEVELDEQDFQCYVMNQWHWAASFAANTIRYVSADRN